MDKWNFSCLFRLAVEHALVFIRLITRNVTDETLNIRFLQCLKKHDLIFIFKYLKFLRMAS